MNTDEYNAIEELISEELNEHNFIEMVKAARELSRGAFGLRDAKHFVQRLANQKGIAVQ